MDKNTILEGLHPLEIKLLLGLPQEEPLTADALVTKLGYNVSQANQNDPLNALPFKIYTALKNKYYLDELYHLVFVRPAYWISETFSSQWIDKKLIDGILHNIARLFYLLGIVLRRGFDLPVVNGAGDKLSDGTRGLGGLLRSWQGGKVQQYMVIAILLVLAIGAIFFYLTFFKV